MRTLSISVMLTFCLVSPAMACIYHPEAGADHNSELISWMTDNEPTISSTSTSTEMSSVSSKKIARHTITGQLIDDSSSSVNTVVYPTP